MKNEITVKQLTTALNNANKVQDVVSNIISEGNTHHFIEWAETEYYNADKIGNKDNFNAKFSILRTQLGRASIANCLEHKYTVKRIKGAYEYVQGKDIDWLKVYGLEQEDQEGGEGGEGEGDGEQEESGREFMTLAAKFNAQPTAEHAEKLALAMAAMME